MTTLKTHINSGYWIEKETPWKKTASIVTMTSYHGIRVEDTADLPIVLGTVMAPAFLWSMIRWKINNCKRLVLNDEHWQGIDEWG